MSFGGSCPHPEYRTVPYSVTSNFPVIILALKANSLSSSTST